MQTRRRLAPLLGTILLSVLSSCSGFFFAPGIEQPDFSRPVVLIELRGHESRLGAATTEGIVFLNEDDASGACRVHYYLGPDVLVDDGDVRDLGGVYARAEIDLKTQAVPVLTRELTEDDELVALVFDRQGVERVPVALAKDDSVTGYALAWPGRPLPSGAGIFLVRTGKFEGQLQFVGLASGLVTLKNGEATERFITFTGPARMREALATPKPLFKKPEIRHRPDGISVRK